MTLPTRALGRSGLEITVLGSDQNRDADEVPQILGRLALGEAINNYETVRQRKDGEEIYVSLTISPICYWLLGGSPLSSTSSQQAGPVVGAR